MALIQAQIVRDELFNVHPNLRRDCDIEIVPLKTSGDWKPDQKDQSFLDMGANKGLFTKEIEEALLVGTIDLAVHSMKDVSVWDPPGLMFGAMIRRVDPRDALLSPLAPTLEDLPKGARVGTASLRRAAQILALRPDLKIVSLRGNVDTRLRKLAAEEADATILAVAGLSRLGALEKASSILDPKQMLPAVAQGVLGLQVREDNEEIREMIAAVNHGETVSCVRAERALLRRLDGSCRTPIAGLAVIDAMGDLMLEALAARPDGTKVVRRRMRGPVADAEKIGLEAAESIRREMPSDIFEG